MQRRLFLRDAACVAAALPVITSPGAWALPTTAATAPSIAELQAQGWQVHDVTTTIELTERTANGRVWLPLAMDELPGYQRTLATRFEAPGAKLAEVVATPGQDTRLLRVAFTDTAAPQRVILTQRIATRDRAVDLGAKPGMKPLSAAELRPYLQPTSLAPLDGKVKQTAEQIQKDAGNPADTIAKAQAIYDWVIEHTRREGSVRGCGTGNVAFMLESGNLSGKCADLNGLWVALARATGIPARDAYGVRVDDSVHGYKSLGKSGDVTKAQHCRADFYAEGHGWIPVDPADVRKVMLEEQAGGLALTDPKVRAARAMLFGAWEMNWIAYNHGHDVPLAGSQLPPAGFLMYPQGETTEGRLDSLDPATFKYQIRSEKVAA